MQHECFTAVGETFELLGKFFFLFRITFDKLDCFCIEIVFLVSSTDIETRESSFSSKRCHYTFILHSSRQEA